MDGTVFRFKRFHVHNALAAQKVGTDGVLLGTMTTLPSVFQDSDGTHLIPSANPDEGCRETTLTAQPANPDEGCCETTQTAQPANPDEGCRETTLTAQPANPDEGCERREVLDIGTGTGVVALILAQRLSDAEIPSQITGIDIDGPAADSAALSFSESPWAESLSAVHMSLEDFADSLYGSPRRFDLIVSNPPYYDNSLSCPDDRRNLARHTDSLSWREVITFAGDFLTVNGRLAMILPKQEEKALLRFAASFGLAPARLLSISTAASKPARRLIAEFVRNDGKVVPAHEQTAAREQTPARENMTVRDNIIIGDENYFRAIKDFLLR